MIRFDSFVCPVLDHDRIALFEISFDQLVASKINVYNILLGCFITVA